MPGIDHILKDALKAYGSFKQPNYSFAQVRLDEGLYDSVIDELAKKFSLEETTDLNDDVARFLVISPKWSLALSLVGSYAIFARSTASRSWDIVSENGETLDAVEKSICEILRRNKITLLDVSTISREVDFSPVNSDETRVSLYRILFEDADFNDRARG